MMHRSQGTGHGPRATGRGFTLIELIAVTSIIAMTMAFGAAQLDWIIPKYRLRGVAREIGALMKQVRSRALGTGKDVYLVYDLSEGKYWALAAFPLEDEELDPTTPPSAVPRGYEYQKVFEQALPDDVHFHEVHQGSRNRIASGQARIRIPPYGIAEHHIVNLRNDGGRRIAVRLNGFTGHLTFYDEFREPDEVLEDTGP